MESQEVFKPKLKNYSHEEVIAAWNAYRNYTNDDPWGKRYQWWRYCEKRDGVEANEYPDNLHRYQSFVYKRMGKIRLV